MMLSRIGILIALLTILTGCAATVVRAPEPMAAPTAWSARIDTTAAAAVPVSAWWEELADEQLNRLVELALRDSAEVSVAAARVRQARALAKEAGANRLPEVDVGVAGLRERVSETSLRYAEEGKQTIPAYRQSNFAARLDARYEVDLLGRLALGERAAAAESAASYEELRAVRQWLAREVVLAYADLRLADERAAFSRESSIRLGELLNSEQERLKAGLVARERLRESERTLAETSDAQAALGQERHAALARLANLLGNSTGELQLQARADYFSRLGLSGAVTPDLPATALERRADVAAAWQRVLSASDQAERARLERYPSLTLTGSAGYVSEAFRRWLTGDALAWLLQAALQAPLFDGGRIEARTEQARAAVDELHAHHRKLVVNALAEAETALSATQAASKRVAFAESELARRVADRAAAADLRSAGIGSRPELVQKEIEQLAAAETLSARRHDLLLAWANTQKALGR
jgi:NodT family efflux transporter outer membrane factor (OMF) lipoprotein